MWRISFLKTAKYNFKLKLKAVTILNNDSASAAIPEHLCIE